jgi:pSer/pThr/pTyr-binding forkhead associated (FHA) protein
VSVREKTQTAVHSPLSPDELPGTAILLMVGAAETPSLPAARRLIFVRDELEIGRSPSEAAAARGTALMVSDPLVSSEHARILRVAPGAFEIADLNSKNGTLVDNVRLERPARLRNGALVFFGNQIGLFRIVSTLELEAIKAELVSPLGPVATASPVLAVACDRLRRLAGSDAELLILGETGVGKEVYARAVHVHGGRRGRFTAINCAAIPRELVESELFGYRQGAHSTAHQAKAGLIEEAEGGTLFLDEIGEMTHEAQIKLLRFLQDRELTPLGSTRPRKIDVRIIAATNRISSSGKTPAGLRDDIIARLGASPIHLPPLRHRIEDVGALVGYFLRQTAGATLDQPAFRALALYEWPLNVRELEKIVTTAAQPGVPRRVAGPSPTPAQIEELLQRYNGNVADVSRELGKHRAAVWRWMKKWGIGVEKFKKPE